MLVWCLTGFTISRTAGMSKAIDKIPPLPEMIPLIRCLNPDVFLRYTYPSQILSLLEVRQMIHLSQVLTLTRIHFLGHWESTRGPCPAVGRL
jgi:hypothetical protein